MPIIESANHNRNSDFQTDDSERTFRKTTVISATPLSFARRMEFFPHCFPLHCTLVFERSAIVVILHPASTPRRAA